MALGGATAASLADSRLRSGKRGGEGASRVRTASAACRLLTGLQEDAADPPPRPSSAPQPDTFFVRDGWLSGECARGVGRLSIAGIPFLRRESWAESLRVRSGVPSSRSAPGRLSPQCRSVRLHPSRRTHGEPNRGLSAHYPAGHPEAAEPPPRPSSTPQPDTFCDARERTSPAESPGPPRGLRYRCRGKHPGGWRAAPEATPRGATGHFFRRGSEPAPRRRQGLTDFPNFQRPWERPTHARQ